MSISHAQIERPPDQASDQVINPAINPVDVRQTLERVLASKYFSNSPRRTRFLKSICDFYLDGRLGELNEYLLGVEVLGLKDGFDPGSNPAVRVLAHEVRKKLDLYYENEGADDEILLEIPVGRYQPIFTRRRASQSAAQTIDAAAAPPLAVLPAPQPRRLNMASLGFGVAIAVLAGLAIWLAVANHRLRQEAAQPKAPRELGVYGPVWRPFLASNVSTLLVLNNLTIARPVFKFHPPIVKDNTAEFSTGRGVIWYDGALRPIAPGERYFLSSSMHISVGEAIASIRVADLFRSFERDTIVRQSRTTVVDDLKDHNAILLGSHNSNQWSGKLPLIEDFLHLPKGTIANRNPRPGEKLEYTPEFDLQGRLKTDYALITVKPNITEQHIVMVLAGCTGMGSHGAGEFVTKPDYLNELNQRLQQLDGGVPGYYQVLLKVETEDNIPAAISIVSIHELRRTSSGKP